MMRWVLIVLGVLVALVLVIAIVGWMLPVKHHARRGIVVRASPQAVYALVTNVQDYPRWRRGVSNVEIVAGDDTLPARFREHSSDGAILYEVVERVPDRRVVTRIADAGLPFGGQWTYEIAPAADGATSLTITEDGEVYNPIFRFVSRFVMGHTATIERWLGDAAKALGTG